jgi:hypothetical protein
MEPIGSNPLKYGLDASRGSTIAAECLLPQPPSPLAHPPEPVTVRNIGRPLKRHRGHDEENIESAPGTTPIQVTPSATNGVAAERPTKRARKGKEGSNTTLAKTTSAS